VLGGDSLEPQEFLEAGDQVVVVARLVGRGKTSGVAVTRTWAYVWTLRNGKALRMVGHADRAEALESAGLTAGTESSASRARAR
jgi:ketosteroid isomerase-like protein